MKRGRPRLERPDDMVLIWSLSCAELRLLKTGQDCGGCPYYDECETKADKLIGKMMDAGFTMRRIKVRREA